MTFKKVEIEDFMDGVFDKYSKREVNPKNYITFDEFKKKLETLNDAQTNSQEENQKSKIKEFLDSLGYMGKTQLGAEHNIDLAIKDTDKINILFEVKSTTNTNEFIKQNSLESKALYESILYFMRQRACGNASMKFVVLCTKDNFYIIDAKDFDKVFWQDSTLNKEFLEFEDKTNLKLGTKDFYKDIAPTFVKNSTSELSYTHFNIKDILQNEKMMKHLYSLFHPDFLLKKFNPNTGNTLNQNFYNELLYILGLQESKDKISLLDTPNTLSYLIKSRFSHCEDLEHIMPLIIVWTNRILFLKLLESQLISFNPSQNQTHPYAFFESISSLSVLNNLFFKVLNTPYSDRSLDQTLEAFANIPYLNSSLFSPNEAERNNKIIGSLDNDAPLKYYSNTILKSNGKKHKSGETTFLSYLKEFLNAYNFSTLPATIYDSKPLINASVLGLVFEKLNGYQDGSFYTPSSITMYMCRDSIQKIVLEKFSALEGVEFDSLEDVSYAIYKKHITKEQAIKTLDSITICDPAVGSGHFLVSALNELIYIRHSLGLSGLRCDVDIQNDELVINVNNAPFVYEKRNGKVEQSVQEIQKGLFELKKEIIESQLFGVDINRSSVNICCLRLWIELLKNSYYTDPNTPESIEIETLPNIDINIKCGNSLVSRFDITDSLEDIANIKESIRAYKESVNFYKDSLGDKKEITKSIDELKEQFALTLKDPKTKKAIDKLIAAHFKAFGNFALDSSVLEGLYYTPNLFPPELSDKEQIKAWTSYGKIKTLRKKLDEAKSGEIYKNAFEWRFEFPEVLDENGDFMGFDLVIGNPPYIQLQKLSKIINYKQFNYATYSAMGDIYCLFIEKAYEILKSNGVMSFITSNKYTRAGYGEPLRKFLLNNTSITHYIDLNGNKIFDNATVDTSILTYTKLKPNEQTLIYFDGNDYDMAISLQEQLSSKGTTIAQSSLNTDAFIFGNSELLELKTKIEKVGTPLKEWDISINYGIKTGYNEAFIISTEKKDEILSNCENEEERTKTEQLIKPILRGRDIKKYSYMWSDLWLIGTFPTLKLDIEEYPALKTYLESFMPKIEQSGKEGCRKKTTNKWFETQDNIAYYEEFEKEKIVYNEIGNSIDFCKIPKNIVCNNKLYFITFNKSSSKHLSFFIGVLNSKALQFYFNLIFNFGGGKGSDNFENISIPKINNSNQKIADKITLHVEEILKLKADNPTATTTQLEEQIDNLVYELYGLSDEEIGIVRGLVK